MASEIDYQDYQRALQFDERLSRAAVLQHLTQILVDELEIGEKDRVLDVGTGTGRLALALAKLVPRGFIVGIDPGSGMLRVAREKVSTTKTDNFFLVQAKAEAFPFLPKVFDSACLMISLHHFSDPEQALKEIHGALRAKGQLVSVDPVLKEGNAEDKRLHNLIEEAFQLAHGPEFRFFVAGELRELYQEAGFSILSCETYSFPFNQIGIQGIPMGPHWLEAYGLLKSRNEESLIERFEQNYFTFSQEADQLLVKGKLTFAVIKATRD